MYPSPESAVMKTKATDLPLAAFLAEVVSVSLVLDVTVAPMVPALVVMADRGSRITGDDVRAKPN